MAQDAYPQVPGFTVVSQLGRGGMARVYLAREERLRRLVALKVIDDRYDGNEDFRRRFEREARTAAGLTHPNIVPVYAYGFTDTGSPYLSMAFLDGGSLRDRLRKGGPLRVDEALAITRQIASALQAAHSRNVVHRDLKPDNVMFQGENTLLTDFGIAKVLDATIGLTGTGVNPGTVSYFSPEQAEGKALDQRSDIYTLGVVLYEMLTGRLPIEAKTYPAFIHGILTRAPTPLPEALRGLQPFLDILLTKDPADRLNSCSEVMSIVDAMIGNWMRYGSVERLSDGVEMRRSGRRAAELDLDEEASAEMELGAVQPEAATAVMPPADSAASAFVLRSVQTPPPAIPATDTSRIGTLRIDVTPRDALVTIDYTDAEGEERTELWRDRALRLPTGELQIHVRAPGFQDLHRTVWLAAGERDEVLELLAVPALASAPSDAESSEPVVDAEETSEPTGTTLFPIAHPEVPGAQPPAIASAEIEPVAARLDVAKEASPRADSASGTLVVGSAQTPTPAIADSDTGRTGTLRIDVTPRDALVTIDYIDIDGEERSEFWRGRALRLPTGELNILARAPGFQDLHRKVWLAPWEHDEVLELHAVSAPAAARAGAVKSAPVAAPAMAREVAGATPRRIAVGGVSGVQPPPPTVWSRLREPRIGAAMAFAVVGVIVFGALTMGGDGDAADGTDPDKNVLLATEPRMVTIQPGCFQMGSANSPNEQPVRQVCIRHAFGMGVHEVSFAEYDRFVSATGAPRPDDEGWGRGSRPVINVSWNEASEYARWLSLQTGKRYRLPSEAEWEYAARAGTTTNYWFGDGIGRDRANCDGCGSAFDSRQTAPVGSFAANPFGLYDVHGNVWEWVHDCYTSSYDDAPNDGLSREQGSCSTRVLRGGSWAFVSDGLRSAYRSSSAPGFRNFGVGFRLALVL